MSRSARGQHWAFRKLAITPAARSTVGDGTHTANITLLGQYVAGQFAIGTDGGADTLVTDPPAGAAIEYAMAASRPS